MNKKGQVLVAFVLLLPVLLMLLAIMIDCGILYNEKRRVDNNIRDAINYGLDHLDSDILKQKLEKQINTNIDDINKLEIQIENEQIKVSLEKTRKSIFTSIFSKYNYKITSNYKGYFNNNKKVIRKV